MADRLVPDSVRTLQVGVQATGETNIAATMDNLRAVLSFEPLYTIGYETPRFENFNRWGEEDAIPTTTARGMRITSWVDTYDIGYFLTGALGPEVVSGSTPTWLHTISAMSDPLAPNPLLSLGWTDGTSDGAGALTLYRMIDGRVTQLQFTWDYANNSWRVTTTIEGSPYTSTTISKATAAARNRTRGKLVVPAHTMFKRATVLFPLITGNITINNGANALFMSTTGSDPDGTANAAVGIARREEGDVTGRYELTYDKRSALTPTPFEHYVSDTAEVWLIKMFGMGGTDYLQFDLPRGKAISGGPNLGQRSSRETVSGLIGLDPSGTPAYPFRSILANGRATSYTTGA